MVKEKDRGGSEGDSKRSEKIERGERGWEWIERETERIRKRGRENYGERKRHGRQ